MDAPALDHRELMQQVGDYARRHPVNVAPYWRARALRQSVGQPLTCRRARALNEVLACCQLPLWRGELLVGAGKLSRLSQADWVPADQLAAAQQEVAALGGRSFGTHSDHHAPDYPTLLRLGLGGVRRQGEAALAAHPDPERRAFLESALLALDGAIAHLRRWAREVGTAAGEPGPYRDLLGRQAAMMAHLATEPPRTFAEALQLVYSFHGLMQMDDRYAMAFGRLDQYLWPCYAADRAAGRTTREAALALLTHFFAKITWDGDVQNIALGGVQPADGSDATNELSFLVLDACRAVGRPGGNLTARIHRHTPPAFLAACADLIRSGLGYPAVFNDEVQVPALVAQGYPLEHARDYCFVGCIEVFLPGRMAPWADSRFNLLHGVNLALHGGVDSLSGKQAGPATGEPATWDAFYAAYRAQLDHALDQHVAQLDAHKRPCDEHAASFTSPLMSALTDACLERGRDLNDGGARYPANHGVAAMGIGSTADSLAAIRQFVYAERRFSLAELRALLAADFAGHEAERLMLLKGAPKYGNDDDRVDQLAVQVTRDLAAACQRHRTPQGGFYWPLMAANVANISAGQEVGATADGRKARQPLSDAASPTFGRDAHGPTAAIRSIAKLPYALCPGGNVINLKLHPSSVAGPAGLQALAQLIRTCFDLGGIELQFNTVDREVLQEAMAHPADHSGLVVRVSGFSAHFVYLQRVVQADILARTEHRLA